MKAKYTPGPWGVGLSNGYGSKTTIYTRHGKSDPYAERYVGQAAGDSADEAEANARLIAASPSLLEACKRILPMLSAYGYGGSDGPESDQDVAVLRAAVALA